MGRMMKNWTRTVWMGALCLGSAALAGEEERPRELGRVQFERDLGAGLERAEAMERPAFVLFQEIPGCATCVAFGKGPLSHPLMVEAIEDLFVPIAVYNNRGGADGRALQRFGEPSWNNPVVRFLDAEGDDWIPRRDGVWSTRGIAQRMRAALVAANREVPVWFETFVQETGQEPTARAHFAMPCYWSGEARLGSLEGVVNTKAGWLDGREVVTLTYRPSEVSLQDLIQRARGLSCAARVWVDEESDLGRLDEPTRRQVHVADRIPRPASSSDQLYYLGRSPLRWLPLTSLQRRRVNSALGLGSDPAAWLSPRQRDLARRIEAKLAVSPEALRALDVPDDPNALAEYARTLDRTLR